MNSRKSFAVVVGTAIFGNCTATRETGRESECQSFKATVNPKSWKEVRLHTCSELSDCSVFC